jgi:hypothetical protein
MFPLKLTGRCECQSEAANEMVSKHGSQPGKLVFRVLEDRDSLFRAELYASFLPSVWTSI